ncbi:glutathione synthetase [Cadophora sp. DSE1049]|nr:glutathione synthetase [Cadophora sp. DSE1049]
MRYPPDISDTQFETLVSDINDWHITHGTQLKVLDTDNRHTVLSQQVGTTLFPTLFPKELFEEALALQTTFNKLYAAVTEDDEWLFDTLKDLIDIDPLSNNLWTIYREVKQEGYIQDLTLGIFRSDYMLHASAPDSQETLQLKQVEFNTIACAGGVHSNKTSDMHRHFLRTGTYESSSQSLQLDLSFLPPNHTLNVLTQGLISAHQAYGPAVSRTTKETCILMIVQPNNFNMADERPIEYALWDASIPCFRVIFGYEVLSHTSVAPSGELIYQPPHRKTPLEVSVVYFRSGFEVHEYDDMGHMARFQLEKSRAIKCPNILGHLATFKKVQQVLVMPGVLERFLPANEAVAVARMFVKIWPMDESLEGEEARKLALDRETVRRHVLKPSLEGGGHNLYGEAIVDFLRNTPQTLWHTFVLMEKIAPPLLTNTMVSSQGIYEGPVISELGVFGVCLWERGRVGQRPQIVEEINPCWSFKTKKADVDEMSVVKGYGCFDSPALVDEETFEAHMKIASK